MKKYDASEVVVTLLDYPNAKKQKTPVEGDSL